MREEVDQVVAAFAAQARHTLDHDRLSIYLLTPDGERLERFAVATSPALPGESDVVDLDDVGLARVLRRNEAVVSPDFGRDQRLVGREDAVISQAGFRALVSVPLRTGGMPFGVLNFVSRTAGFYDHADVEAAQRIADQIAGFLLNLRLQRAMRIVAGREAMERERNRVAREFHDTLAQVLAEITIKADALAQMVTTLDPLWGHATALRDLTQRALDDVRRSLHELMPAELEGATLVAAIERHLEAVAASDPLTTGLRTSGDLTGLPHDVQITVFRIVQQAVANARRHGQAETITVQLQRAGGLTLVVTDDGCGFDQSGSLSLGDRPDGFGLKIMHDRARMIGGELTIVSSPGAGTEVRMRLADIPDAVVSRPAPRAQPSGPATIRQVIRLLIVDDHAMLRESLADLLRHQDDIRVVGQAGDARQALRAVARQRPDIVLLDLDLPDMTGVEVARRIVAEYPDVTVIMMSGFADSEAITQAMAAGARGYLDKSIGLEPLVRALRSAAQGIDVFVGGPRPTGTGETLTPRQLQVVASLARGQTNAEIAHEMHLAVKTVERMVATVVTKLGARNRTHAVGRALTLRLISVHDLDA